MFQQPPHRFSITRLGRHGLLALGLFAYVGCAGRASPESVPRRLEGHLRRGQFIPPFAYEAYVRGELLLAQGKPAEAAAQLELATAAPEEDPYLLSRLAYAQAKSGQNDLSARTLAQADRLDPCSEAVWLTRGQIAEDRRDLSAAAQAYERASECAPSSDRGPLARAAALERAGKRVEALETLGRFAGVLGARTERAAYALALRAQSPAELAYAFETWLSVRPPSEQALEDGMRWALDRDLPLLALRLSQHHRSPLPALLEAQLKGALGDREGLAALLARTSAEQLGGAKMAAELALKAGSYERCELEATSALSEHSAAASELHALRARARLALGRTDDALVDYRAVAPEDRKRLALELLALGGYPALSGELSALEQTAQ